MLVRNGKKYNGTQSYLCKDCGRRFIADHEKTYRGCLSGIAELVKIMLVRGVGIRDISVILRISVAKIPKVLAAGVYFQKTFLSLESLQYGFPLHQL
jgi:transposase-like protein